MGSTIPFGDGVEDHGGIDQSGDQAADKDEENEQSEWSA
jgi:hypothetical protein